MIKRLVLIGLAACATEDIDETAVEAAVGPPDIGTVLTCGNAGTAGGLALGSQLQRFTINTTAFPLARCNDGTPAVFYVRPAATAANQNKWVIQLQGGGSCRTPEECADRWCSQNTRFGSRQMSSALAPAAIDGQGILFRGAPFVGPFEDANHVFIRYCSSDSWTGRANVAQTAPDPITGVPRTYSIAFRGYDILDAVITTLRRNNGAAITTYTLEGPARPIPDLDAGTNIVLAGASAGGTGVIQNGDRIRSMFPAADFRLLIDSIFLPNPTGLFWSGSTECPLVGPCNWQTITAARNMMFAPESDSSCDAWHAAFAPGTAWLCDDGDHVIRNHVLTPMMIRMGLTDSLLSSILIGTGVETAPGVPLTPATFESQVRTQLGTLPAGAGEEARPVAPAIFAPRCAKHETLRDNAATFGHTITKAANVYAMFEIWNNWVAGFAPSVSIHVPADVSTCP